MPPLTPMTRTRLAPGLRLLWRDERTLQIGLEDALRVDATAPWVEPLLSRMSSGFRRTSFDVIAHGLGAPRGEARALFERVAPFLVVDAPAPRPARVDRIGLSDARAEYRLRESLEDEGVRAAHPEHSAVVVVLVAGTAAAVQFTGYLRDDVAHLPVALERDRATIGPLVLPGDTPCLTCRDGHERDRDPAWPRLHSQLIDRDPGPVSAALVAGAGAVAARLLAAPATSPGEIVVLSADGSRRPHELTFHGECLCRETSFRSRPGTATVPVPRVLRIATTTATGFARRA